MPVYFIQSKSLQNDRIILTGDLAHHLRDVLRCRPGESLQLVDEKSRQYHVSVDEITPHQILARILQMVTPAAKPDFTVVLAQAILKGKRMDWLIQKATELGVTALIPVVTERTIARPRSERESHQTERWKAIAQEAAQQCGRLDIPLVQSASTLEALLKNTPQNSLKMVLWEAEQDQSLKSVLRGLKEPRNLSVLIGPEGGFSPQEIDKAHKAGWISVSLGRRILRAETAGLALLAILEYELNETR